LVAIEENRIDDAIQAERRAVAIVADELGASNPALIPKLVGLVRAELAAGHIAEARAAASRALDIARASGDPGLAQATREDADVRLKEGRYAQAVAGYDRALELAEKQHGPAHPDVLNILRSAVDARIATSESARAVELAQRAYDIARNRGPWRLAQAELAL